MLYNRGSGKQFVTHSKESAVSEDVDEAVYVWLAGKVESGTDMSAGGDDYVLGELGVQSVVDVRALVGENMVQVRLHLVEEGGADYLCHC